MSSEKTKLITFTGMFAALVFIATWAIHVPAGLNGGYIHLGDAFVYLAAAALPLPYAMLASAIGAGLADLFTPGAAVWVLPTIIIKPLCCLPFTSGGGRILCKRNILAMLFAALITIFGYGVASAFITGSIAIAILEIPFTFTQSAGNAICFTVIALALDKSGVMGRKSQ